MYHSDEAGGGIHAYVLSVMPANNMVNMYKAIIHLNLGSKSPFLYHLYCSINGGCATAKACIVRVMFMVCV